VWTEVKNFMKCLIQMNAAKVSHCTHVFGGYRAVPEWPGRK